jgi:hypothetical protein
LAVEAGTVAGPITGGLGDRRCFSEQLPGGWATVVTVGGGDGPGQFPEAGVKHAMRSDAIWGPAWIGARLVKLTLIDALP